MGKLMVSQVSAEAGLGQSDPITLNPFHFLIFDLPRQVFTLSKHSSCMWFGHSLQRHKTAPTMLTKFWLGYPNVIAAPWHLKSCSHPDSQHWMGKHSLLLVLQLPSTAKSKAKCWMCKTLEAYVLHPALPQVSCLWHLVFPLWEDDAMMLTWGLAGW